MARADDQWWAAIIHQFKTHVREEGAFLEAYERLVHEASDPSVKFLIGAVLDDERRHHALFEAMADAAAGAGDPDTVPPSPKLSPDSALRLLEPTERFLEAEQEDRVRLAQLRRQLKPVRADTLWPLLVELMEIDTGKHIRILEYLRDRLRDAAR